MNVLNMLGAAWTRLFDCLVVLTVRGQPLAIMVWFARVVGIQFATVSRPNVCCIRQGLWKYVRYAV